jgi:alpha-mannosidase
VDVEVRVDTRAEDHRLRMLLPTDCPGAKSYLAHQAFDFVERAVAIDPGTVAWQEMEQVEKPFLGMQAIGEGARGLAVLSASGPHEGGIVDDFRRTMLVTLIRSFRKTVGTGGESDGLETGSTTFQFRLLPFANNLPRAEALAELAKLQSGLLTRQTGPRPSGYPKMAGDEPATQGFMDCLSGNLVVSAIKTPESGEGLIVRLWNPTGQTLKEEIVFSREVVGATPVLLNEDPLEAPGVLARQGNKITVLATPKKIITLRVVFRD